MKNVLILSALALLIISCKKEGNFTLTGSVKGLKKGTLYLQRLDDVNIVNLDSMIVDGDANFELVTNLQEPEVLFLHLEKADESEYDDRIRFFAEAGEMTINTQLQNFEGFAVVTGSQNQNKLKEYEKMNTRFNERNLDLLKGSFEAQAKEDGPRIVAYDDSLMNLIKTKYRYTGNFVVTNKELEVAPYIALTQIPDATIQYLDTIYNSFPRPIRKSLYGKQLEKILNERKSE